MIHSLAERSQTIMAFRQKKLCLKLINKPLFTSVTKILPLTGKQFTGQQFSAPDLSPTFLSTRTTGNDFSSVKYKAPSLCESSAFQLFRTMIENN